MTTNAIVPSEAYRKQPALVAWWMGKGYTCWHIAHGEYTWCGRRIPTRRSDRLTRSHHPRADVCKACVEAAIKGTGKKVVDLVDLVIDSLKQNPAGAVTPTGQDGQARQAGRADAQSTTLAEDGQLT